MPILPATGALGVILVFWIFEKAAFHGKAGLGLGSFDNMIFDEKTKHFRSGTWKQARDCSMYVFFEMISTDIYIYIYIYIYLCFTAGLRLF